MRLMRFIGLLLLPLVHSSVVDDLRQVEAKAQALVSALVVEARDYGLEASRISLCHSPLLRRGYELSVTQVQHANPPDWATLVGNLCN